MSVTRIASHAVLPSTGIFEEGLHIGSSMRGFAISAPVTATSS